MLKKIISDEKIYEIALDEKKHHEQRRDAINGHYIALFSGIIAIFPFINNLVDTVPGRYEGFVIRMFLSILALIGLTLSVIWLANLKRILFHIEYLDRVAINLEKTYDITYKFDLFNQLEEQGVPDRITKYQLIIPRMFILIFSAIILYILYSIGLFLGL